MSKAAEFVKTWMAGHEPGTFAKNEHGEYVYTCGAVSLNLEVYFQELYEDCFEGFLRDESMMSAREVGFQQTIDRLTEERDSYKSDCDHNAKRAMEIAAERDTLKEKNRKLVNLYNTEVIRLLNDTKILALEHSVHGRLCDELNDLKISFLRSHQEEGGDK